MAFGSGIRVDVSSLFTTIKLKQFADRAIQTALPWVKQSALQRIPCMIPTPKPGC